MDFRQPADRAAKIAETMAARASGHVIEIRREDAFLRFFVAGQEIGRERFSDSDSALAFGPLIKHYWTSHGARGKAGGEHNFIERQERPPANRPGAHPGPAIHALSREIESAG